MLTEKKNSLVFILSFVEQLAAKPFCTLGSLLDSSLPEPNKTEKASAPCGAHAHPMHVIFSFWVRFSLLSQLKESGVFRDPPGAGNHPGPRVLFSLPTMGPAPLLLGRRLADRFPASHSWALNTSTPPTEVRA